MGKLVFGIGVNDADYQVYQYEVVDGKRRPSWKCPFYSTWASMIRRCYDHKCQAKYPTYKGCFVCEEWLTFSNFKEWMERQDWEGKQLDKDILIPGNKEYCSEACVFVDKMINCFISTGSNQSKSLPIGVSCGKGDGVFQSHCRNPFTGKGHHLGYFKSADEAHVAWRKKKHELALLLAATQTDERLAFALRTRFI